MINWTEIENKLYEWAKLYSGNIETIWQNQASPQPTPPYITLKIMSINKIGYDDVRYENNKHNLCGLRRMTFNVQVFGNNSLTIMTKLKDSLEMSAVEILLKSVGLGIIEASNILDINMFIDTIWEARHNMDVFFYIASNVEISDLENIESVHVEGILEDGKIGTHEIDMQINS